MNVNSVSYPPNAGQLIEDFRRLESDLSNQDYKLEDNARYGRVPSQGWNTWFADKAMQIQNARDGFTQLRPNEDRIIYELGKEVVDMGIQAGKTEMYQKRDIAFGRGWGEVLDSTVNVVRDAINALHRGGNGGGYPGYPDAPGGDNGGYRP
ncbi:MAG: hypothetical protein JWM25_1230 [Thermoleophilia bacterium]|nr:hypothetical protein [Thermoleophilia bacterium]MCZ4496647.1 hypothetical protein [Thermoleophilia bacterium]